MNTKILKKMCIVGATTCLGLTCVVAPAITCTSCSANSTNEFKPIKQSNITVDNETQLIIDLSDLNLDDVKNDQQNKCAYVLFEVTSTDDKATFTYDNSSNLTKTISLVEFNPTANPGEPTAGAAVEVNCPEGLQIGTTYTIKATVYKDDFANVYNTTSNEFVINPANPIIPSTSTEIKSGTIDVTFYAPMLELLTEDNIQVVGAPNGSSDISGEVKIQIEKYNIADTNIAVTSSNTNYIENPTSANIK